jgi:DNA polymerase III epsilon subunit-like protein
MQAILFDTETTDLIHNHAIPLDQQPRIIEIYAMKIQLPADSFGSIEDWQFVDDFESFVNPGIPITDEITRITNITDKDVKDAPRIAEIWPQLRTFFETADMVVAHNVAYDIGVMDFEQMRVNPDEKFPWPKKRMCTVEATEHLKGYRLTLTNLHKHLFGVPFDGAHRARTDVKALSMCFKKLWEDCEI